MAHFKAKFDKVSRLIGGISADIFLQLISFLYRRECQYDDEGLCRKRGGNVTGTLRQRMY